MKKCPIIFMTMTLAFWAFSTIAGELSFPTTKEEIVKALSLKDGKMVSGGVEYVSEKGKVYKIIDGKRYRLRGIQVIAASDILPKVGALINFDFDSTKIRSESYPLIDEFGKALKQGLPKAIVIIAGHTDSKGSIGYNQVLSENRAKAVTNYLLTHHGIMSKRIIFKGYGETKPIASNETNDGRFRNRRVEFIRVE
jgi:outer membrane protein OmpA-like peptidoglycan-associated protein